MKVIEMTVKFVIQIPENCDPQALSFTVKDGRPSFVFSNQGGDHHFISDNWETTGSAKFSWEDK